MIGILAGMGPKSTGPFIDQVVSEYQSITGAKDDIDFPPMLIYSLPTPFYLDRPIDHKLMEKTICAGLQKLESCGSTFIAMPCNTAHLYFAALQGSIGVPLLNIVEITLDAIPASAKNIALLGTRPTIDSQVFQKGLRQRGLNCLSQPDWQKKVDELILQIKMGSDSAPRLWQALSADLLSAHIDTVVLVCTDLNVLFKQLATPFQMVDSALCLAQQVVHEWLHI